MFASFQSSYAHGFRMGLRMYSRQSQVPRLSTIRIGRILEEECFPLDCAHGKRRLFQMLSRQCFVNQTGRILREHNVASMRSLGFLRLTTEKSRHHFINRTGKTQYDSQFFSKTTYGPTRYHHLLHRQDLCVGSMLSGRPFMAALSLLSHKC